MGIYIKNMEKPDNCGECPLMIGSYCAITDNFYFEEADYDPTSCPIEEEPTGVLAHDIRKVIAFIDPHMIIASTYDEQIERAKAVKDWLLGIVAERRNDE